MKHSKEVDQDRLNKMIELTAHAAQISMAYFRKGVAIEAKADDSPVTLADRQTEIAIREVLEATFPGEPIFGEEFGLTGTGSDSWIIDPIDGTRSFISGLPLFGLLLGFLRNEMPHLGVIRMPALNEVFAGGIDLPATCNGSTISVSTCTDLGKARLAINEGDKIAAYSPQLFERLIQAGDLRRMGADCYPHALVAMGQMDAVIDFGLQPYDFLPVSAVVHAAGGMMADWQGRPLSMQSDGKTITAATPELLQQIIELINE